ncbi:protein kinase superfamily protein [Striga asiatica]|uniref:Protein kinase superfamily protein n=1 Tax=Striga asiatica TaxID=4170 RepID=A0A5A7PSZ9_STRAF|nr:protein kinase superfamily protein [Striga asiatica]
MPQPPKPFRSQIMVLLPPPPLSPSANFSSHPQRHLRRTILPRRLLATPAASSREVDYFTQSSGYLFELSSSEAESLTEYNVSKIAVIYQKRPLILFRRLFQTAATLGKWFALRYYDSLAEQVDTMFEVRISPFFRYGVLMPVSNVVLKVCVAKFGTSVSLGLGGLSTTCSGSVDVHLEIGGCCFLVRAAQLRKILVQLGPAYIKIAQAISSRPDLIPPSYLDELSLLQDRIAPFSTEVAFDIIEQELGLPIAALFSEISPEPVAAASLGQACLAVYVYQARLRSSGKVVAIKVQRPGVRAAISLDILILRYLAGVIRSAGKFNTDLQEMDYKIEAENGVKFRQLYGNIQDVVVPEMYVEQTTRKVLTMQWVEGQKLAEVKDLYMIEVGVYCSFNQLLEYGFYHADPHPGNLLRTYDGKLAYLDFGMMGEFKQELRDGFIEACLHLVNRDYDSLAEDFVTLGFLPLTADKDAVTEALTGVFRNAVSKGVRNISFEDLLGNLGTTILAVLEGIAITFNPEYKVLGNTYPWIARKVLTGGSPKLKSSLQALLYEDGVFRIDRLESLLTETSLEQSLRAKMERASVKEKVEDESKMVTKQILSFALDEKGAFVREILLEEFSKGLDALGLATLDSITSAITGNLPFRPYPASSLTDEDITNLRTLQRLMQLLSGLQHTETPGEVKGVNLYDSRNPSSSEAGLLPYGIVSGQEMLPLLSLIAELPQDSKYQLLRLPADLAGKLVSRAAARTIRRAIV